MNDYARRFQYIAWYLKNQEEESRQETVEQKEESKEKEDVA